MLLYDFRFVRPLSQGARTKVSFLMKSIKASGASSLFTSSEHVLPESTLGSKGLTAKCKTISPCVFAWCVGVCMCL